MKQYSVRKIKCPYCEKEFDPIEEIIEEIKKSPHNINSLSKTLDIRRSTLVYYLDKLEQENKIYFERLENFQGRPTIIKLKGEIFECL